MKFVSVMQASKRLNVCAETIYNMCKDGRLGGRYSKGVGKEKGMWQIDLESIELFEKTCTFKSKIQLKENFQISLF